MPIKRLGALQKKEIGEVLANFGMNEKEQEIYLALLSLGPSTLTPLARRTGLPLTTVQSILPRLTDLGVVKVTKRKSRHVYEADDPVTLRRILERRIEETASVIPILREYMGSAGAAPKIQVYYRERVTDIFHEALACKSKLVHEIVAARDIQDVLGEKFHYTRRRIKNKVRLKSLRVEAREIKKYSAAKHVKELREARFLPRELTFRASIMFWDDTVAFFSPKNEGLAWTVVSPTIREMTEQTFSLLWDISRKMETA